MPLTRPTTTPMPDEIYDLWAPRLSEAELKALLYIVRRTLGFHKRADAISLKQFAGGIVTRDGRVLDHGCGITSRPTLVRALRGLEEKGLIHATKARTSAGDRAVTVYALTWEGDESDGGATAPPASGSSLSAPPGALPEPGWFASTTPVVAPENHGGARMTPTTNSRPTNSQQNSGTGRAPAAARGTDEDRGCLAADADGIWRAVIAELRGVMTADNVAQWLLTAHGLARDGQTLRVGVPSPTHAHWLDRRLRPKVEAALGYLGLGELVVTFEVAP